MNRLLLALGVAAGLSGCTITAEDLGLDPSQLVPKLEIDKDVALAYTEMAMKQAGMSAAAVTAGVPNQQAVASAAARIGKASVRPVYGKLAVTADQCVQYTDVACTDAGVCSYTEDYSACGTDFVGKITREFSGTYETYKILVDFQQYAEKPSTDTAHYAFNGTSKFDGMLGMESASLNMHTDGESASYIGDRLIHLTTSLTMSFKVVGATLTIDGTQAGTIKETGQTGTMTITELTFDDTCAEGPVKGTVKTMIDGVETVTTITGCGAGTIVVGGGEAEPIDGAQLADTFIPGGGEGDEPAFGGIVDGTSGGSLLSGDWLYEDAYVYEFFSIYEYDGTTYIYHDYTIDNDLNGYPYDDADQYGYGSGVFTFDETTLSIDWDYYDSWVVDNVSGDYEDVNGLNCDDYSPGFECSTVQTHSYELVGSDKLVIGGTTYTRQAYVESDPDDTAAVGPAAAR